MKKKLTLKEDDLRQEYDLSKLKLVGQGLYFHRYKKMQNLVKLNPKIAKEFPNDASVNQALELFLQVRKMISRKAVRIT